MIDLCGSGLSFMRIDVHTLRVIQPPGLEIDVSVYTGKWRRRRHDQTGTGIDSLKLSVDDYKKSNPIDKMRQYKNKCLSDYCDNVITARGLCHKHYKRMRVNRNE